MEALHWTDLKPKRYKSNLCVDDLFAALLIIVVKMTRNGGNYELKILMMPTQKRFYMLFSE